MVCILNNLFSARYRFLHGILVLCLTLLWTAFIFMQSANNAAESIQQSNKVVEIVENTIETVGIEIKDSDVLTHLIRKSAHFLEFGILGALSFLSIKAFRLKHFGFVLFSFGYCVAVACLDEYIQTFFQGRSCQISDVILDISGSLCAVLVLAGITHLFAKRKNKNNA